jgi:hypothetical protein
MPAATRAKLDLAAKELSQALRQISLGYPLRIKVKESEQTNTGGWSTSIATLGPGRPGLYIELWFDK